jgi:hypothetical protein
MGVLAWMERIGRLVNWHVPDGDTAGEQLAAVIAEADFYRAQSAARGELLRRMIEEPDGNDERFKLISDARKKAITEKVWQGWAN